MIARSADRGSPCPSSRPAGAARRHREARGRFLGDLRRARLGHGRPLDLALFVQPAKELLKGPVACCGRGGRGAFKLGRDERLTMVPVDAARGGGHALAGHERHEERPSSVWARMVRGGRRDASRRGRQDGRSAISSPTLAPYGGVWPSARFDAARPLCTAREGDLGA
jgi:hypothetical protein